MRLERAVLAAAAVAVLCGSLQRATADDRNPLDTQLIVDLGWFFMSTDTRVRLDGESSNRTGTDINFDDTFGLGKFDRFRGEVLWRFADRHVVRAMYFRNNRSATRENSRTVDFGDQTYPVGITVTATSKLTIGQLSYDYAFLRREDYELAAGIGVHVLDMQLGLSAALARPGQTTATEFGTDASTTAPLPVVGLRGVWRLSNSCYLTAQAQYFDLSFDRYSGSIIDLKTTAVWQASDHLGIGVGYNDFGFKFDIDDPGEFKGRLRWDYGGALAFVSFMF